MYHIIYSSQAKTAMTLTTLVVLLMQARALNERQHVTGALVYGDGQFMQVMEGEEAVIKDLYARVLKDPRHYDVRTLAEGPIASRSFAQWSMAFGEVPAAEFQVLQRVAAYQTPAQLANQLATSQVEDDPLLAKMKELVYTHAKG
ncbi:MAG: BLUF domain-containing protein [Hymenobacter sp.]|nr:MAG: BLUF domain-containing protein [Hymenobacter sp.]